MKDIMLQCCMVQRQPVASGSGNKLSFTPASACLLLGILFDPEDEADM